MDWFNKRLLAATFLIVATNLCAWCSPEGHWTGYLVDHKCAETYKSSPSAARLAKEHTRDCDLQSSCNRDGFEIYSDGKWYELDAEGNNLALIALKRSVLNKNIYVSVYGDCSGEKISAKRIVLLSDTPR